MAQRFEVEATPLNGLAVVRRKPLRDERGLFSRLFCEDEFRELGLMTNIRQVNQSQTTRRGAVRGMHFQHPPHGEVKFVSCLRGEIFDVALDLRRGSPTFMQWHGQLLSADNFTSLCIPEGFAHGFQALSDECEMIYLHSMPYSADAEGGLNALDKALDIRWPLAVTDMSDRDRQQAMVGPSFGGIEP